MAKVRFQNISRSTAMHLDMNFLGSHLLRNPKALANVFRAFTPKDSFISFLANYGVSVEDSVGAPGVINQTVGESLIRWRIVDSQSSALRILDASLVPSTISEGTPVKVTLNDGWVDRTGLLLSSDGRTIFEVITKEPSLSAESVGTVYTLKYVTSQKGETIANTMLNPTKYLNYIGNNKGEKSSTSQELMVKQSSYDMFNVTQVLRHKVSASGHALSTTMDPEQLVYFEMDPNNNTEKAYGLPFGSKLIQDHLKKVSQVLFYGRTNFDPVTRAILPGSPESGPTLAGIKQQMEYTDKVIDYDPYDTAERNLDLVQQILSQSRMYFQEESCDFIALTGMGGEAVLLKVQEASYKRSGFVRTDNATPGYTISKTGHRFEKMHIAQFGSFKIVSYGFSAKERGMQFDQKVLDGVSYDIPSFDIFFIPIKPSSNYAGKRNFRLATKAANGINRGLVLGVLNGMSGLAGNGMDIDLTRKDYEFIRQVEAASKVSSPVDGDELMALSEITAIVEDPDDIIWMRPKFSR